MKTAQSFQPLQAILPGARLITCASPVSFHSQLDPITRELLALSSPQPQLRGLDRAIAAHKLEVASAATVKTYSARTAKPISELHGLQKAIAANRAERGHGG